MTSLDAVGQALKRYKSISFQNRYGGRMEDYKLAQEAIEEWESMEKALDLNVTVELDGRVIESQELLDINEADLSTEYAAQAARFAYVAVLAAEAKAAWAEAERRRKEDEALAFQSYKNDPEAIPDGSKSVTDGYAGQLVQSDENCNKLKVAENEAEKNYRILSALTDALQMRASMLISMGADLRTEREQTGMKMLENPADDVKKALSSRRK